MFNQIIFLMKKNQRKSCLPIFRRWTRTPYAVFNSLNATVKIGVLGAAMLTIANQEVLAQNGSKKTESDPVFQLEEVQVNSDLPPTTQQLVKVVTVLDRKDISRAAVQNVQDLLRYVQGIDLRTRGSESVQADVNLRGGSADQTAVLLNGVNLTDPQTGHFNMDIPLDIRLIDRIEILYGPGAWTAGAISFSGAINIVTRQIIRTGVEAGVTAGDHGYGQAGAVGYLNSGNWRVAAAANGTRSDGFTGNTDFGIFNAYANVRYITNRFGQLSLQAGVQSKNFGANSFYTAAFPNQYEETRTLFASLQYKKNGRRWSVSAGAYYRRHHDRFELFRDGVGAYQGYPGPNFHLTDVAGATVQANYRSLLGVTSLSGDLRVDHIYSNTLGMPLARSHYDPYEGADLFVKSADRKYGSLSLKQVKEWRRWNFSAGLMGSGNDDYGFRMYAGGNVDYAFSRQFTVGSWVHNSYRMPTFTELYYNSPSQQGNPGLNPEEAFNADFHLVWTPGKWTVRGAFFSRYGYRVIDWVKLPSETVWKSTMLTDVHSLGTELAVDYRPGWRWLTSLHADYSYLHVNKRLGELQSLYTLDYLKNQAHVRGVHPVAGRLSAAWQVTYNDRAGSYKDLKTGSITAFKPYAVCDLKVQWDEKHYRIFAEATNLFDTKYFDFGNLPQPGIWVKAGLSVKV
jgi:iron complex outermembrane receptor protein